MAVIEGKPLTKRIVTVTGDGVKEPGNFYVWLGTNYRQLLEAAGGPVGEPEKYISGGPMMGFSLHSLDFPVLKGTGGLLLFDHQSELAKLPPEIPVFAAENVSIPVRCF